MEVINNESLTLNQRTFEDHTSSVFQKDNSKEINLMYQQYAVAQSTSSNHCYDEFELHAGLTDKNWEIRQNTLSKLLESIPNLNFDLQLKVTKEIFRLVTINLGHMMSDVRKLALDVIIAFVKNSKDPETVTKDMIVYGVDSATIDTNLSLKTIQILPKVLKYVLQLRGNISHQLLAHIVTSLSKRMIQITHQRQVISSLLQIKLLIGDTMFDHFMETYYPQIKRDFDVLYNVYGTDYSDSSDLSEPEPDSFFIPDDDVKYVDSNIGDMEDLLTEENYAEEMNSDDDVIMKVYDEDGNEIKRNSSRRVTFGGEIVKIRTPDSDATALANNIKEKLDISANIIVQISSEESDENEDDDTIHNKEEEKTISLNSSCSHIPLPIRPALNKPKHPKQSFKPFKQPSTSLLNGSTSKPEQDLLMEIPNYEGESLTSSSDSSDRSRKQVIMNAVSPNDEQKLLTLKHNTLQDLEKMNINDRLILETLFKKDDWRFYICSMERLSQILCQPHIIQHISSFSESTVGVSLLCYLFNTLSETKNNRVISSSLRALRFLCQAMQSSTLALYLNVIVPTFCSYLQCTNEYNVRLEAVEILKMLMRKFSPQTVVNVLFTEQCFYSKSSKMRENSLLCLMYALITFPSTEFNMTELIEALIQHGIKEPKRRVRQALLDTLAILGQLVPKSKFKVPTSNEESMIFKKALRARLTRRQLPSVSQSGLILYAFQISPATAFGTDIEWIMAGSGSLADNYSRPKAQFNFVQGDDISPADSRDKWDFINENKLKLNGYSKNSIHRKCDQLQNQIIRGSSEEALYSNDKYFGSNKNYIERYSADWTDPRTATSLFETMYGRYPSNLSDMSSCASSYTSEYSFPRLNPGYESNLLSLNRPVSEDKLNRLPWPSKYGGSSKLPLRLEPAICQLSSYYSYKTSSSLPVLSDKKERNLTHFSPIQKVNNYLFEENRHKWSKANEKSNIKLKTNETELGNKNVNQITEDDKKYLQHNEFSETDKISNSRLTEIDENLNTAPTENGDKHLPEKDSLVASPKENTLSILNENKTLSVSNGSLKDKPKKFLERKTGVRLKRSLTKEIKMPQSTFSLNPEVLPPFEQVKDGLQKTLLQFESNEWETIIEALQNVIRLTRHHNKQLSTCLHPYVIAVSKEIRSLRSQVARAACLSAENIFKYMNKISDQDIEELSHALFSRAADTNKFLRQDSNKALDAMIDNVKFSKCIVLLTQKVANHPNALLRAATARLLFRLIQKHGPSKILSLTKDKKELVMNTAVKFLMDGNLETRTQGKNIFQYLSKDKRTFAALTEIAPSSVISTINKIILRSNKI